MKVGLLYKAGVALVVLMLLAVAVKMARGQELVEARMAAGVICEKVDYVREAIGMTNSGVADEKAIEAINEKHGAGSCVITFFVYTDKTPIGEDVKIHGKPYQLVSIMVHGIAPAGPEGPVIPFPEPIKNYSAFQDTRLGV